MKTTKFTIHLSYHLTELKKAYAFHHGYKHWRKIKKKDVAIWISCLASADVDLDLMKALDAFK